MKTLLFAQFYAIRTSVLKITAAKFCTVYTVLFVSAPEEQDHDAVLKTQNAMILKNWNVFNLVEHHL